MSSMIQKFRSKIFAKVLLFVSASIFLILFSSLYVFDKIEYEENKNELLEHQNVP